MAAIGLWTKGPDEVIVLWFDTQLGQLLDSLYTVAVKEHFISPHPDGVALFLLTVLILFHMHVCTISIWIWSFEKQENERPAHSLID